VRDLASTAVSARDASYRLQREPYAGRDFPEPGEDAELVAIIKEVLGGQFRDEPSTDQFREVTRRIYTYVSQENKRRNLVGEGFEDALAAVIGRLPFASSFAIRNRWPLHELPGFHRPPPREKQKKVDIAILRGAERILVSAKWSVRADREEQFTSDFDAYSRLEAAGQDFAYVLITNEFDAARLSAACDRRRQNSLLFSSVVHICPEAVLATYGDSDRGSVSALRRYRDTGRLLSLREWLRTLDPRQQVADRP
jgi:hypothetical protein